MNSSSMSQHTHERTAVLNGCIGIRSNYHRYPPQPSHSRVLQGGSNLVDGSWRLSNMYLEMAREEDTIMAEGWHADAEGILLFTGLFSAVIASLISLSTQAFQPSTQAGISSPSSLPRHVVVVNTLWFLSLSISLTCALLATLLQQWARRYVKITHKRHHPRNRARIRAFFAEGVDKLHLSLAVRALPTLLHSSLFLFFVGLVVFLFHFNSTVFKFVAAWVGICTFLYACITLLPIFRHDSPYNTPLSSLVWFFYTGSLCLVFQSLQWLTAFNCFHLAMWVRFRSLRDQYYGWFLYGMEKAAEEFALGLSSDIDGRALIRTLETLDEDDELEAFFEGIPGFFNSEVVSDPHVAFKTPNGEKMSEALVGFMCNTLSSNLVPEPVKQRRIEICRKAVEAASLSINRRIFDRIMYKDLGGLLNSVEFGLFLRRFTYCDAFSAYYSQCVISVIVTRVQERNSRWFELAMGHLDVSKAVLGEYLDHGDSLLLANCITICRHTMDAYSEHGWDRDVYSQSKTLELLSKFNVQNTLPRLKVEFCALWNKLVKLAQSRNNEHGAIPISILRNIRQVFIRLHQDTIDTQDEFFTCSDNDPYLSLPLRYPFCDASSHRSNSVSCFDAAAANTTGESFHRNTLPSHLSPYHDIAFNPTIPSARPTIQYLFPTADDFAGTSQHSIYARNCALESPAVASLVMATTDATEYPTNNSASGTTSIVNTTHPLMETEPSPPFPIAVRSNAQSTDPLFHLPTSVPGLEFCNQTHSGTIHFLPTSVNPPSLSAAQESFVSSLSVSTAAGGVHRCAQDLSLTTPTESHQHPHKTALPFPGEGSRDGGQSTERNGSSENPAFSQKWGADKQSLSSSRP